jgi:hypothetical protein
VHKKIHRENRIIREGDLKQKPRLMKPFVDQIQYKKTFGSTLMVLMPKEERELIPGGYCNKGYKCFGYCWEIRFD